ncbi:hypothetical protein LCGC14_2215620 [marine sediment metagenome]|uniref:Uncharacterized protein n=1 Tax=marine sediment metagenome TaxID=412755 RepID=A0A0F9FQ73_9ZZZZ
MENEIAGDANLPHISYTVLAIDMGETTGIALYDVVARQLRCDSTEDPESIVPLIFLVKPHSVILERFPENRTVSHEVEIAYGTLSKTSILISPGAWKPFMKSRKRYFPQVTCTHEKDAVNMLRYYLLTNGGEDIS